MPRAVPFLRRAAAAAPTRGAGSLEDELLRRSVGAAEERQRHCLHCRRVPLIGEQVHVYASNAGEGIVCALCRPLRREAPARSLAMPSPERDRAVRVLRAA